MISENIYYFGLVDFSKIFSPWQFYQNKSNQIYIIILPWFFAYLHKHTLSFSSRMQSHTSLNPEIDWILIYVACQGHPIRTTKNSLFDWLNSQ